MIEHIMSLCVFIRTMKAIKQITDDNHFVCNGTNKGTRMKRNVMYEVWVLQAEYIRTQSFCSLFKIIEPFSDSVCKSLRIKNLILTSARHP